MTKRSSHLALIHRKSFLPVVIQRTLFFSESVIELQTFPVLLWPGGYDHVEHPLPSFFPTFVEVCQPQSAGHDKNTNERTSENGILKSERMMLDLSLCDFDLLQDSIGAAWPFL